MRGLSRVLKISVVESRSGRRWLWSASSSRPRLRCAKRRPSNREPVIDLKNLTAISQEGEYVLLELMNERVKFRCGVFTKHVLNQLARRTQDQ